MYDIHLHPSSLGLVAQAVRRSTPTAGVPSPSMWVSWWTKRGLGRFLTGFRGGRNGVWVGFSRGFSRFLLPPISFHHFSTLISSISFHFIRPCDGASGVVGRHPCYSRTYNVGLHRISSLDPTLCWTRVEDSSFIYTKIYERYKIGRNKNSSVNVQ